MKKKKQEVWLNFKFPREKNGFLKKKKSDFLKKKKSDFLRILDFVGILDFFVIVF